MCCSAAFPMDELTKTLSASFAVSREPNSTSCPHPRLAQYKTKYSVLEQSERRRRFLDLQKTSVARVTLQVLDPSLLQYRSVLLCHKCDYHISVHLPFRHATIPTLTSNCRNGGTG